MFAPQDEEKWLQLLNQSQPDRPWRSAREKRLCIACERVFRGKDVVVNEAEEAPPSLGCPGCGAAPELWVRLGNPLTDAKIWNDWESAMSSAVGQ